MDRAIATALVEQLCRNLPRDGTPEADDFDYGWFRERVASIAQRVPPADAPYVWQQALWHLDAAGLIPEDSPRFHA